MLDKKDFLENNTLKLLSHKDKLNSFSTLKKFFSSKEFIPFIKYDHQETYLDLISIKNVIDRISSIVFKPHISAVSTEVIKRSELASSLSPSCFKDTLRDTKNWKNKNGSFTPEYVHDEEYVDTLVTYENRFIAMLIDNFYEEVSRVATNLTPLDNSLEKQYETRGISYGDNSILNDLGNEEIVKFKCFVLDDNPSNSISELSNKLKGKIKHLMASEFYKENHKMPIVDEVKSTNILLHDPLYFYCYKYYLKNFKITSSEENNNDVYYYNYALLEIINYLQDDIKSSFKIDFSENKLIFDEFSVKKGNFEFLIKPSEIENSIEIVSKLKEGDLESSAKYLLIFSYSYSLKNNKKINSKILEFENNFDDITLCLQNNLSKQFSNILNISIYNENNNLLIKNYFNSLSILFKTNPSIYEKICPVCGEKHIVRKNDEYLCVSCSSHYQLFNKEKETFIWIKSLRRKELWKEK